MQIHETSKTKILATIGPATETEEKLRSLIVSGIDVCRLNFSHGSHEVHNTVIKRIRKMNNELGTHIAILADLQGPKIRLGEMQDDIYVDSGEEITVTNIDCIGSAEKVFISYPNLPMDSKPGDIILLDDGKLKWRVVETDGKENIKVRVVHGGPVKSRKGVNLPQTKLSVPSLTEKDLADVKFILEHDLDWIALSFVRSAEDIRNLRKIIREAGKDTLIMAKIEKPEAVADIDAIVEESDAIMVARGDLGVEVSFEKVPLIQKKIVETCVKKSTPVVIATQMLESMISNFRPTRAEANDVANAVFDGADAVMLSGETSVGAYPIEAIQSMQRIIDYAEGSIFVNQQEHLPEADSPTYIPDSVCYNACKMADQAGAKAIIAFAAIPKTAFRLAGNRPKAPIYIFTSNKTLMRQLSPVWGVRTFYLEPENNIGNAVEYSLRYLKERELLEQGDVVLHVSSIPIFDFKGVNTIKLSYV